MTADTKRLLLAEAHETWILRIKAHAAAHYTEQGWDIVVESFEDEDFVRDFLRPWSQSLPCTTYEQALRAVEAHVELLDERRRDVQAEAF